MQLQLSLVGFYGSAYIVAAQNFLAPFSFQTPIPQKFFSLDKKIQI